jgi:putative tryptophan/tyrosine transport system substrate-binding protein
MTKPWKQIALMVSLLALILVACAPAATPVPPTEPPVATAAPTAVPATNTPAPATGPKPGRVYRIGYSQIVDHPALNDIRQGFLDGLKEAGFVEGENLEFDYQNAQGEVTNAHNIAEKFLADQVDLIATCTTPNSQAAVEVAGGSDIPVVFGCVTDPVTAGILDSLDAPSGTNVTGQYNPLPITELFDLFQEIDPDMKQIGTIYTASEDNSVFINSQAKAEAEARGLEWIEVTIASSADVKTAAESLVGRVDTLVIGQDNTIASALEAIVQVAEENQLPLFAMDPLAVERGAVASLAANQYDSGFQWAQEMVVPVLLGTDPGTMTPTRPASFDLQVNLAAAATAGLTIPQEVIDRADNVYGQ